VFLDSQVKRTVWAVAGRRFFDIFRLRRLYGFKYGFAGATPGILNALAMTTLLLLVSVYTIWGGMLSVPIIQG